MGKLLILCAPNVGSCGFPQGFSSPPIETRVLLLMMLHDPWDNCLQRRPHRRPPTSVIVANIWLIRYAPQRDFVQPSDRERRCLRFLPIFTYAGHETYAEHERTRHIWPLAEGVYREGVAIEVR